MWKHLVGPLWQGLVVQLLNEERVIDVVDLGHVGDCLVGVLRKVVVEPLVLAVDGFDLLRG